MANLDHLAVLKNAIEKQEISIWNAWYKDSLKSIPDLSGANLRGVDIRGINLNQAHLFEVDFTGSNLSYSNLAGADLSEANLSSSILKKTNMNNSDLRRTNLFRAYLNSANLTQSFMMEANLTEADLGHANLTEADLGYANLTSAICYQTIFNNVNLETTIGLKNINHRGPSYIDTHTITNSGRNMPDIFLRGCGVSESIIDNIAYLVPRNAIEYYSCFISYSTKDQDFAKLLFDTLQGYGIRCWYAPEQLLPGHRIDEGINRGIQYWDKVLLCASKSSLTEKWWVDYEINKANKKARDLQRLRGERINILIPLNLDGYMFSSEYEDDPNASQFEITLAANFVGWKNDLELFAYEAKRVALALQINDGIYPPPKSRL